MFYQPPRMYGQKKYEGNIIFIQQDNAESHVDKDDERFFLNKVDFIFN